MGDGYFPYFFLFIKLSQKNATCIEDFLQKYFLFAFLSVHLGILLIFCLFLDCSLKERELFANFSEYHF